MRREVFFLDSVLGMRNNDNVTGAVDANYYRHSYNVTFPLRFPIRNINKVILKSFEIPLNLNQLRYNNGTVQFGFTFSYGTYSNVIISFLLTETQYTISSLITAINTKLPTYISFYSGMSIVLSTNSSNYCIITHNCTAFSLLPTPLNVNILGFVNTLTSATSPLTSVIPISLYGVDTCLLVQTNFPITNNNNIFASNQGASYSFKIPINNIVNGTLYYNDTKEHQTIHLYNNDSFLLDKIDIKIYDRLGISLIGYQNWTATLLIEYDDDVNKNKIEYLNIYN